MFQFNYRLKVAERVKAKCNRHPRYNPERDGRGGIKGGCSTCFSLFDLHQARLSLDAAHREFLRRAMPGRSFVRSGLNLSRSNKDHRPFRTKDLRLDGCVCSLLFHKKARRDVKKCPPHLA